MKSLDLLDVWGERAQKSSEVHYRIASSKMRWNGILAFAVVAASTFVGSTMFVKLDDSFSGGWRWVLAIVSVATATLAGLQRTLRLAEAGEKHRAAGARWDSIFNRLCVALTQYDDANPPPRSELAEIERRMGELVKESPYIPQRWFRRVGLAQTYARLTGEDADGG